MASGFGAGTARRGGERKRCRAVNCWDDLARGRASDDDGVWECLVMDGIWHIAMFCDARRCDELGTAGEEAILCLEHGGCNVRTSLWRHSLR